MSNKGIRELKRKQKQAARRKRKSAVVLTLAGLSIVGAFKLLGNDDNEFKIQSSNEIRYALADKNDENLKEEKKEAPKTIYKATSLGFDDLEIENDKKLSDDKYQDTLKEYVRCAKNQYAYLYPDNYSKTDISINEGDYVAYYGSENGFSKIKLNDAFYYVNIHGLEKLDSQSKIKVVNGISYVSSEFTLPEDFNPGVDKTAQRALFTMRQDMQRNGLDIKIASDYRDYSLEEKLHEAQAIESDVAGESEHQLGQAFDLFTEGDKYSEKFANSNSYKWLMKNAYKYGFILRYPEGKEDITGHKKAPWHFRYVGVDNAKDIYENDLTLEEYLKIN